MAIKLRLEVWENDKELTSMESRYETLKDAYSPFASKDIANFLASKRVMLASNTPLDVDQEDLTIKERLAHFLRWNERAPKGWFTSSEIKRSYEVIVGQSVRLSTISTYLASLHVDGVLERKGSRAKREYRMLVPPTPEPAPAASYSLNEAVSNPPRVQKSALGI
jgi:hypothetical protein